jgi:hypothetical protein
MASSTGASSRCTSSSSSRAVIAGKCLQARRPRARSPSWPARGPGDPGPNRPPARRRGRRVGRSTDEPRGCLRCDPPRVAPSPRPADDGLSWLHRDGPPGPIWSHLVTQSSRASMPRATKNRRSLMANGTGPGRGARDPERGETALSRHVPVGYHRVARDTRTTAHLGPILRMMELEHGSARCLEAPLLQ